MIHTIRSVAVGDQESKIDSPIILYRGDREVEVEFTINGSKFTFTNGGNVIKSTNATHGQLVINTPTGENMFSEVTECHDGKVVFVITKEMIDELIEVGFYSFQIRLFDESQVSRVTIPPVLKGIDIRKPIAAEDETNVVDIGLVDYAVVVKDEFEDLSTFLPDGNYNKTEWESKDVISGAKLNKIEDALYNINSNMEATDLALLNMVGNVNKNIYRDLYGLEDELNNNISRIDGELNNNISRIDGELNNNILRIDDELDNRALKKDIYLYDYEGVDDTSRLGRLIQDVTENYKTSCVKIVISEDIEINSDLVIDGWENKNIEINGDVFFNGCNAIVFKRLQNSNVYMNSIRGSNMITHDEVETLINDGVCFSSCFGNNIHISKIYGFRRGLILEGRDYNDGLLRGSFNNRITFKSISRVYDGISIQSYSPGWVNENIICDGSLDCVNGLVQGDATITQQSSSNFHNNKFLYLAFEKIRGGNAINLHAGRSNIVLFPRFEGSGNPSNQLIINEGVAACLNAYITSQYTLNASQINLNTAGVAGSYVMADLRDDNGGIVGTKMIATPSGYAYEGIGYVRDVTLNNTLITSYNDEYLFSYKDSNGNINRVGYFEDITYVESSAFLNSYANFSETSESYGRLGYYKTGNNEVVVTGVIKPGSSNAAVFKLPTDYKPTRLHVFPVFARFGDSEWRTVMAEVRTSGHVYISSDLTGSNRIFMDGIRFKI